MNMTPLVRSDITTGAVGEASHASGTHRNARQRHLPICGKESWRYAGWACALMLLCLELTTPACTIPVFRYALDRWQADAYRLEFSADALKDSALADFFRNLGSDSPVNLAAKPGAAVEARLLFPHPEEATAPIVWTGALTPASLKALTDSPARRAISSRILAGESVVWVLVESGDKAADDALATRVEKRLRYLEQVAILPRIDPNDPTSQLGPGPVLRVKFSLLRIPRAGGLQSPSEANDSNRRRLQSAGTDTEAPLLKMLAGPKPDAALQSGAWLAAVFGRGRVLGAWPAADFGDAEIEEVCLFLLGACSCQVKRQNPGWDLLMNVAWEEELTASAEKAAAAGSSSVPPATNSVALAPETVKIQPQSATEPSAPAGAHWPVTWTAAGLALLLGFWVMRGARS